MEGIAYQQYSPPARREVRVVLRGKDTKNIVILVNCLAIVSPLDWVPPVAIRVAMLSLDW